MERQFDMVDYMRMRASTYGFLARLFRKEIGADELAEMRSMQFPAGTGNPDADKGYELMADYLEQAWDGCEEELAIDYVRTFIGHGVNGYSAAYPFESVHTSERRLMMQEARAEVLKVFRDNLLKRGNWTEGEDHIALELEFMQRMALRCADDLQAGKHSQATEKLETQMDFAKNHLLNWLPILSSEMRRFSKTSFYQGLSYLALGFVEEDYAAMSEFFDQKATNAQRAFESHA